MGWDRLDFLTRYRDSRRSWVAMASSESAKRFFDLCKIAEHIAAFFERQIQYGGMWIGQCLVNRYGFDVGVLFQRFDWSVQGQNLSVKPSALLPSCLLPG